MKTLKQVLFDEYGGFSDGRIRNLDRASRFTIDDRSERDLDARGELFLWFCEMHADVSEPARQLSFDRQERTEGGDVLTVTLHRSVPNGPGVRAWVAAHESAIRHDAVGSVLSFEVPSREQDMLRGLAAAMRAVVAPGAPRYEEKSYKYVCPRTADSLDRLAKTLESAWSG